MTESSPYSDEFVRRVKAVLPDDTVLHGRIEDGSTSSVAILLIDARDGRADYHGQGKFDAEEILACFNEDGTPIDSRLAELRSKAIRQIEITSLAREAVEIYNDR